MTGDFFSTHLGIQIVTILVGLVLLIWGRKLFWLAVGVIGFVTGLALAFQWTQAEPGWVVVLIALLAGVIGAVLASLAQKIAVGVAGFLTGGYAAAWLAQLAGIRPDPWVWILLIIGGIIGAGIALSLLEPALIGLTALAGAALVAQAIRAGPVISALVFVVLLVVGVVIQVKMLSQKHEVDEQDSR